jgi:hypothetical protein
MRGWCFGVFHHFDSTIRNALRFRDDDIIIAIYAKSETTCIQQIMAQLLSRGDPDLKAAEMSPWLDLRNPPKDEKTASSRNADPLTFPKVTRLDRCTPSSSTVLSSG